MNTWYTAENLLISAVAYLIGVAAEHWYVAKTEDEQQTKLLEETGTDGVKLLYKLLKNYYNDKFKTGKAIAAPVRMR